MTDFDNLLNRQVIWQASDFFLSKELHAPNIVFLI